uniref:Uncharacterized protein n=1 Tax=Meloidogyne enterolobii TaxID=390850 RepID=A0A6V7X7T6_MELEN|nr:unnamed protein product [Meloidogyne enterolobii]
MRVKKLLIFSTVILSFYEFVSIKGVDHELDKGKGVSTSHDDQEMCKCGKFLLEQLS